ncbi:MAG: SIR2 family protein [Lachnospiraceae bacterium]|nr:SIR2 family protein [Lachnospiraceae bacterium]
MEGKVMECMQNNKEISNTLMLGNGFSRAIYKDTPDWRELFNTAGCPSVEIENYTYLYELCLLGNNRSDNQFKYKLMDKIKDYVRISNIKIIVKGLDEFGELLRNHNVKDIITTNYDKGIEDILCEKNGYVEQWSDNYGRDLGEKIYSIRRHTTLQKDSHNIRLWKIHGDVDNIASISLGFDQYCGALSKMDSYIKGKYKSSSGLECLNPISQKCHDNEFDNRSWIELFFNSNLYIAGFGLSFSEIDIWWLLNKRMRLIKQGVPINNKIVFLYSDYDKEKSDFDEKIVMLKEFGVEYERIDVDEYFIQSIFENIS